MFQSHSPNIEQLKARRDIKGLIKVLANRKEWMVHADAAQALGEIRDTRAVEALVAALNNVPGAAAEALGKIGDVRAVAPLIAALESPNHILRPAAAMALGKIGDARAIQPLIAALGSVDSATSEAAAMALGSMGAPAFEPLMGRSRRARQTTASSWRSGTAGSRCTACSSTPSRC